MLKFTTKTTGPEQTRTFTGSLCWPQTHHSRRSAPSDRVPDGKVIAHAKSLGPRGFCVESGGQQYLLIDDNDGEPQCVALPDVVSIVGVADAT